MNIKLLQDYAELKAQEKEVSEKLDGLKALIIGNMTKAGMEKIENDFGMFTVCHKRTFKYTEKVKDLEEKVKIAKIKEEEQGRAKVVETTYLKFTEPKE